jgi:hypothetical protein
VPNQIDDLAKPVFSAAMMKAQLLIMGICDEAFLEAVQTIFDRANLFERQGLPEHAAMIRKSAEQLLNDYRGKAELAALPAPSPAPALPAVTEKPRDPGKRGPGRPRKTPLLEQPKHAEHESAVRPDNP